MESLYAEQSKTLLKQNMKRQRSILEEKKRKISRRTIIKILKTWPFYVGVLHKTLQNVQTYNACAQLLFCSLNLLFGDIPGCRLPVAVGRVDK